MKTGRLNLQAEKVMALVATLFSGVLTFLALQDFFNVAYGPLMALLLTLAIQFLIAFGAYYLFRRGAGLFWRGLYALILPFALFASVLTGGTQVWNLAASNTYAQRMLQARSDAILQRAAAYEERYRQFAEAMQALAAYSQRTARTEATRGGTCGDGSGKGRGPRFVLRQEDARIFRMLSSEATQRASRVRGITADMQQAVRGFSPDKRAATEARLKARLRRLKTIASDPWHQQAQATIASRLQLHSGFDHRGRQIVCPDATLTRLGRNAQAALRALPDLSTAEIGIFAGGYKRSVGKVAEELFRFFTGQPTTFGFGEAWPLAIALFLDIASIVLYARWAWEESVFAMLPPLVVQRREKQAVRRLTRVLQHQPRVLVRALRRFSIDRDRHRSWLLCPRANGDDGERQIVADAVTLLEPRHFRFLTQAPANKGWMRNLLQAAGLQVPEDTMVSVYAYDRSLLRTFLVAAAEAAANADQEPTNPVTTPANDDGPQGSPPAARLGNDEEISTAAGQAAKRRQARLRLVENNMVVIPRGKDGHFRALVEVEGEPIRMLVDTGASMVSLSDEDARHIGLPIPEEYTVSVGTANGRKKAARITLKKLKLGSIVVENIEALISPPGTMNESLLGQSFLRMVNVSIIGDHMIISMPRRNDRAA